MKSRKINLQVKIPNLQAVKERYKDRIVRNRTAAGDHRIKSRINKGHGIRDLAEKPESSAKKLLCRPDGKTTFMSKKCDHGA
jgi:hypothetical protein